MQAAAWKHIHLCFAHGHTEKRCETTSSCEEERRFLWEFSKRCLCVHSFLFEICFKNAKPLLLVWQVPSFWDMLQVLHFFKKSQIPLRHTKVEVIKKKGGNGLFFFFFDGLLQHVNHQNPRILNEACPTEEVVLKPAERRRTARSTNTVTAQMSWATGYTV